MNKIFCYETTPLRFQLVNRNIAVCNVYLLVYLRLLPQWCFCPRTLFHNIELNLRIISRSVSGFVTGCHYGNWCRGLSTCSLCWYIFWPSNPKWVGKFDIVENTLISILCIYILYHTLFVRDVFIYIYISQHLYFNLLYFIFTYSIAFSVF